MTNDANNTNDGRTAEDVAARRASLGYAGFSGHENTTANHHDWITPKWMIDALGVFTLDPCQSLNQPWPCAKRGLTIRDDGLSQQWAGDVWLNPPYGRAIEKWIERMAEHGDGIALMFARTDTRWFQRHCAEADALLFVRGRVRFHDGQGDKFTRKGGGASATSPSVLVAFGEPCAARLLGSGIEGIRVVPA